MYTAWSEPHNKAIPKPLYNQRKEALRSSHDSGSNATVRYIALPNPKAKIFRSSREATLIPWVAWVPRDRATTELMKAITRNTNQGKNVLGRRFLNRRGKVARTRRRIKG